METITAIPPDILVWLSPLVMFFVLVFLEQRNKMLQQAIENLKESIDKLSSVLDKQDVALDNIGERLAIVETELNLLKSHIESRWD